MYIVRWTEENQKDCCLISCDDKSAWMVYNMAEEYCKDRKYFPCYFTIMTDDGTYLDPRKGSHLPPIMEGETRILLNPDYDSNTEDFYR